MSDDYYSDYIVFVDESGDHSLESIDQGYPVFVLTFCIVGKSTYANEIVPRMKTLKLNTFGHDSTILHERDIRKKSGAFSRIGEKGRESFLSSLTSILAETNFTLIAIVIDKREHKRRYVNPAHPYHLAMQFGLERLGKFMSKKGMGDRITHILCESRGKKEDKDLELEFRRIRDGNGWVRKPYELVILDKKANCEGLQIADLTARPIGLSVLHPNQTNRAMEVIRTKFDRDRRGNIDGCGLKKFP
ncbi:MAG: DUF3800 domain-containing protein [Rhodothalassiaceae bacterium]